MAVGILVSNNGKLDCHTCDDKLKEERGHDKDGIIPFLVDGKRVFRCPLTFITKQSWDYIKFYNFYEDGFLLDDSEKFLQAMMVLKNQFNKHKGKNG